MRSSRPAARTPDLPRLADIACTTTAVSSGYNQTTVSVSQGLAVVDLLKNQCGGCDAPRVSKLIDELADLWAGARIDADVPLPQVGQAAGAALATAAGPEQAALAIMTTSVELMGKQRSTPHLLARSILAQMPDDQASITAVAPMLQGLLAEQPNHYTCRASELGSGLTHVLKRWAKTDPAVVANILSTAHTTSRHSGIGRRLVGCLTDKHLVMPNVQTALRTAQSADITSEFANRIVTISGQSTITPCSDGKSVTPSWLESVQQAAHKDPTVIGRMLFDPQQIGLYVYQDSHMEAMANVCRPILANPVGWDAVARYQLTPQISETAANVFLSAAPGHAERMAVINAVQSRDKHPYRGRIRDGGFPLDAAILNVLMDVMKPSSPQQERVELTAAILSRPVMAIGQNSETLQRFAGAIFREAATDPSVRAAVLANPHKEWLKEEHAILLRHAMPEDHDIQVISRIHAYKRPDRQGIAAMSGDGRRFMTAILMLGLLHGDPDKRCANWIACAQEYTTS